MVTVTTILIGTRMSAIFQEPCIRARAVGKVPSNFKMCLTIRTLISMGGGGAAGTLRAACVSFLDIYAEIEFAAAFICSLEVLVFEESLIVK